MKYLEVSYSYEDLLNGGCVVDGVKCFTRDESGFEEFIIWYFEFIHNHHFVLSNYAFRDVSNLLSMFCGEHYRVN